MKLNVLPLPTSLCNDSRPPMACTRSDTIASPNPVPPYRRVLEASTCVKGAKIRCWSAGEMPMPVSETENNRCVSRLDRKSSSIAMATPPRSVNLMALDTRFINT